MMDKPKPKNEEPRLRDKVTDLVLLAMSFERELEGSPEECVETLKTLSKPRNWFINKAKTTVEVTEVYDHMYDFECRIERQNKETYFPTAIMKGVIFRDEGIEKTVIRGKMRLESSSVVLGAGVVALALLCFVLPNTFPAFCFPLAIIIFIFLESLIRSVMDSSTLYNRMFDLFPKAGKSKKKHSV